MAAWARWHFERRVLADQNLDRALLAGRQKIHSDKDGRLVGHLLWSVHSRRMRSADRTQAADHGPSSPKLRRVRHILVSLIPLTSKLSGGIGYGSVRRGSHRDPTRAGSRHAVAWSDSSPLMLSRISSRWLLCPEQSPVGHGAGFRA